MNLLEQYIEKVHNAEEIKTDWGSYIKVDVTTICYGNTKRTTTSFRNWEEWEKVKELGFYLA